MIYLLEGVVSYKNASYLINSLIFFSNASINFVIVSIWVLPVLSFNDKMRISCSKQVTID